MTSVLVDTRRVEASRSTTTIWRRCRSLAVRDPQLLQRLRAQALPALVEMARWKSDGHAGAAFFLLGRIGGLSEDEIRAAWERRDREAVIRAASLP